MAKRTDTAARARRLIALLPLLKRGEPIPIAGLAASVGCSAEEVAADLVTLTFCGVPPFTPDDMIELDIAGDAVTVYLEPPGLDRPLKLTPSEARALAAALEAADYDPAGPLLGKLLETASASVSTAELERTVRAGAAPGGIAELYGTLASAADMHSKVRLTYFTGSTGRVSERVVHPWALVVRLGIWYLIAFCESVGEERVFRLDRIRSAEATGEHFDPPGAVPLAVTPLSASLPVAEVRFRADARLPDESEWPGATSETLPDGTTVVRVPYQSVSWISRRVVARLGDAEVVAPDEVRTAVRNLAEHALHDEC